MGTAGQQQHEQAITQNIMEGHDEAARNTAENRFTVPRATSEPKSDLSPLAIVVLDSTGMPQLLGSKRELAYGHPEHAQALMNQGLVNSAMFVAGAAIGANEAAGVAAKIPNPFGKLGGPAHQEVIEKIAKDN
jgi:hypothetical protein